MKRFPWAPFVVVLLLLLIAAAAPLLGLPDPTRIDVAQRFAAPSSAHLLGLDQYGRDIFSQLVWGARTTLTVALSSTLIACVIGVALGVTGGFFRGIAEIVCIRSMDIILCFPPILLALFIIAITGPGTGTLIAVTALLFVPSFARVSYASVLSIRSLNYVTAMRLLGESDLRIMLVTIVPNIAGALLVQFSLCVAAAIILETGLSFLGLGAVPPTPSWGIMIGTAREHLSTAPMLIVWPSLALMLTILAINALCDGLGRMVNGGTAAAPAAHARNRLPARPVSSPPTATPATGSVLDISNLSIWLDGDPEHPIVRDVSLQVPAGKTVALVGESGSGKSLTSLAAMGLLPGGLASAAGAIDVAGIDVARCDEAALHAMRGSVVAMIFQDATSSLNPVQTIGRQMRDAIAAHRDMPRATLGAFVLDLLTRVGIPEPARRLKAYPHQLSGGMKQRVGIATAIANGPRLLLADEPTTALDVTIQAQILKLIRKLQAEEGVGILFVTHSLPVVSQIADRVAVMYAGEIVEQGTVEEVFARPRHYYTVALLDSSPDGTEKELVGIAGTVPNHRQRPRGCSFADRCPAHTEACSAGPVDLFAISDTRATRCIRWSEL